ncbi:hypothetical protein Tco_0025816 [Tanacetum coccineum]
MKTGLRRPLRLGSNGMRGKMEVLEGRKGSGSDACEVSEYRLGRSLLAIYEAFAAAFVTLWVKLAMDTPNECE